MTAQIAPLDSIARLELRGLRAWPPVERRTIDGWVAGRTPGGFTKRANCVYPFSRPADLLAAIRGCEDYYAEVGRPAIFKLTAACEPGDLDALLADRGYARVDPSSVSTRALTGEFPPPAHVSVAEDFDPAWCAAAAVLRELPEAQADAMAVIVRAIAAPRGLLTIREDGAIVSCGLAVLDQGYVGLFDLVTREDRRGRGHGAALVAAAHAWATKRGATAAYLQVTDANVQAHRLYARLGFARAYAYWYRIAPSAG